MSESNPPIRNRIILSIILPVFLVGVVISALAGHFSTAPLVSYFQHRNEAELRLASELGYDICERRLNDLLSLRLENDPEMTASLRAEAIREVIQLSRKFHKVNMLIVEDSSKVVGSSLPAGADRFDMPLLIRANSAVARENLGGQWAWLHYQYFPFWRWHILSFTYERDYMNPILMATKSVYYACFSVLAIVILAVCFVFTRRVNAPLRRIIRAAEAIGHGKYIKLGMNRRDEIGRVGLAFNSMVDNLKEDQERIISILSELKESEERYRLLTENSLTVITMVQGGRLIYANRRALDLLGYNSEELLGMEILELVHRDDREWIREKSMLHSKEAAFLDHFELRYVTKDGEVRWLELLSVPMVYNGMKAVLAHGIDITDKKAAEEEQRQLQGKLLQAQKLETIGTLAGGIAHDFNNILSAIIGYTEMALMGIGQESPVRRSLDRVLAAGQRAKELVSQILAFSRRREQEQKLVPICSTVQETLEFLRASLPSTITINLDIAVPPERSTIIADPTQLHQILINLCTNAADAMYEEGGSLQVSVTEVEMDAAEASKNPDLHEGSYVKLTVRDTGQGMDPWVLERIFDPFFTTKGPGKGTGLGLAVVHGIIKDCGGAITVVSEAGKGAQFDVYFPLITSAPCLPAEPAATPPTGTERILFIDDEEMLVELESEMLEYLGYKVTAMSSSTEALDLFRKEPHRFDLVITDQTMPSLTGVELARELLRIRSDIPIILCTGYTDRVTREGVFSMGIREFLLKPVQGAELARTIRNVLDRSSVRNLL